TTKTITKAPFISSPDWKQYGNDPAQGSARRNLIPELRSLASDRLPDYMVPSAFVVLDALPLTPNGKIDRKSLPAPDFTDTDIHSDVAPSSATEKTLTEIWSDVLRLPRISVKDDFFALGGHSLLATQVISRLRQAFKADLPLRVIFEAPRLEDL